MTVGHAEDNVLNADRRQIAAHVDQLCCGDATVTQVHKPERGPLDLGIVATNIVAIRFRTSNLRASSSLPMKVKRLQASAYCASRRSVCFYKGFWTSRNANCLKSFVLTVYNPEIP